MPLHQHGASLDEPPEEFLDALAAVVGDGRERAAGEVEHGAWISRRRGRLAVHQQRRRAAVAGAAIDKGNADAEVGVALVPRLAPGPR